MKRANPFIIGGVLLALLLLQAPLVQAQHLVVYPDIVGTLGDDGYYISDVIVTWPAEDTWPSDANVDCEDAYIDYDTEGVDLFCFVTTQQGELLAAGGVRIKRQFPGVDEAFDALEYGTEQILQDGYINIGQFESLQIKVDVAQTQYYMGQLKVTSNLLHGYQNELFGLMGVLGPQWLLAETLRGVVTPSM